MYIKTDRDALQRLSTAEMDGVAEFSDNNIAQVTESDGKFLVEAFDHIEEHETND